MWCTEPDARYRPHHLFQTLTNYGHLKNHCTRNAKKWNNENNENRDMGIFLSNVQRHRTYSRVLERRLKKVSLSGWTVRWANFFGCWHKFGERNAEVNANAIGVCLDDGLLPVLGGLDGTGLESFDSAVTESIKAGRFVGILLGIITNGLSGIE